MPNCGKCGADGVGGKIIKDQYFCTVCSKTITGTLRKGK